ncbi:MAG TPA: SLC13/DASS family transporter [Aeromonadales bacterium]|nr:SLC13/DASS family transporter [Aeromonadales bacterium]
MTHPSTRNRIIFLGPVLFVIFGFLFYSLGWPINQAITAATAIWCALWWSTEAIPIPATSLIPLSLLPITGVLNSSQVANSYGSPLILLLLGGFIISKSMEKSGAHRRVALGLVNLMGGENPRRLVFGFMLASAVLSMWISNTATTLMLFPVALAVLEKMPDDRLTVPLLLGVAYAASIGGIGTPVGTPPNLVFMEIYRETTGTEMGFLAWMRFAVPVVIVLLPAVAWWMTRNLQAPAVVLPAVGKWSKAETRVFVVFAITAILWITRTPEGWGWKYYFDLPWANDGQVALLAAIALFIIPDGTVTGKGEKGRLLDWEYASRIPWGVLLLFAGGIALAKGFVVSGLSARLSEHLVQLSHLPVIVMIAGIALVVTFLTEITSNTATTTLLMPILAAAGVAANIDPALLMVPAAISASCAFMLPVATAPNAIVFGSGKIPIQSMIRYGLALNVIGVVVVTMVIDLLLSI